MPMPNNIVPKTLSYAGFISAILGGFAVWIALVPAKMGARGAQLGPFIVMALITSLVIVGLSARKRQRPRSTAPLTFTWGLVIAIVVITALVVSGISALVTLLAAGTLKITLTAAWWAVLWGVAAGAAAGFGIAVVNQAVDRARIQTINQPTTT